MKKLLLTLLFMCGLAYAGPSNPLIQFRTVDPSGTCSSSPMWYNSTLGKFWGCKAGVWTLLSTGTGAPGTVTSVVLAGTANQITVTGTCTITTTGTCTFSFPTNMTLPGNTTGTFIGNITGSLFGTASGNTVTVGSGIKALATSAIGSATCTTAQTLTITGTLTSDTILATFASDPTGVTGYTPSTNGMLTILPWPTADTANFKVCNNTSATITPGAISLNVKVVR